MNYLSKNIKFVRTLCEYSQNEFAEILQITRVTLNAYENKGATPKLETAILFGELIETSIDLVVKENMTAAVKNGERFLARRRFQRSIDAYLTNNPT